MLLEEGMADDLVGFDEEQTVVALFDDDARDRLIVERA